MKKQLEEEIRQLEKKRCDLVKTYSETRIAIMQVTRELKDRRKKLWAIDHGCEFSISDHALMRYLERHKGLDVSTLYKEIEEKAKSQLKTFNDGDYPVDEFVVRIVNNKIVTIL